MLPASGAVVGIDVGYSTRRRSSAICHLTWDRDSIEWKIQRYRATDSERQAVIGSLQGQKILAVALDGPMRAKFDLIGVYREAERMLTRSLCKRIGKPGQSSAPVGKRLNEEANRCASLILDVATVASTTHKVRIDEHCIVEAFPSSFLGVMLADPDDVKVVRGNRSDIFFESLRKNGTLSLLLDHFLPGRISKQEFQQITNHDDRASLVCALTALAIASEKYCAVGDENGWIVLPPRQFIQPWALRMLEENAAGKSPSSLV